jgi:hypothetical protein
VVADIFGRRALVDPDFMELCSRTAFGFPRGPGESGFTGIESEARSNIFEIFIRMSLLRRFLPGFSSMREQSRTPFHRAILVLELRSNATVRQSSQIPSVRWNSRDHAARWLTTRNARGSLLKLKAPPEQSLLAAKWRNFVPIIWPFGQIMGFFFKKMKW